MRRGLRRILTACCLVCLPLAGQAAEPTPVDIESAVGRAPVWQGMRIVKSADRQLAPEQAAVLAAGNSARGVDHPNRILGRAMDPFWAAFSLRNPEASEQHRLLAVETTTQFEVRLFERSADGAWRQLRSIADEADGRIGGGTPHPVWELHLPAGQTVDLLLRIEGPAVVRFPVFAYLPANFAEQQRNSNLVTGIALGGCIFILIYTASLRRYLDDMVIPLFTFIVIADLIGALWLSGFLSETFPALPESALSSIGFAAYAVLLGCGCLHGRLCLDTATWAPRSDRGLHWTGWAWLVLAPWYALVFPVAARVLLVWGGAAVALALVVASALAMQKRVPFSRYIGAAWLVYLISGSMFLMSRVSAEPLFWTSSALVLVQATMVAACFGFAASRRMMQQREKLVLERQEAMLQHKQGALLMRERSLIFAATNHDLRQPLLGVSLFADLLKTATVKADRDEHARKLDMALKEVDELLVGIQQLSALYEATHPPALTSVRMDELLAPIIEEYRGRSEHKRIAIHYVPSELSIMTHPPYFQRIVRNVLSNAIRYTRQGDRILGGCRRAGGLRLLIRDTGRGMSAEQTQRAFDAFRRFDPEMAIPDGFGLGLFSTRSLAKALDLSISLKSQEGRGTEFALFLQPQFDAVGAQTGTSCAAADKGF